MAEMSFSSYYLFNIIMGIFYFENAKIMIFEKL